MIVGGAISVIERDEDGFLGKAFAAFLFGDDVVDADEIEAVGAQPVDLLSEMRGRDGVARDQRILRVRYLMIAEHRVPLVRRSAGRSGEQAGECGDGRGECMTHPPVSCGRDESRKSCERGKQGAAEPGACA